MFIRDCLYTHHVNGITRILKAEIRFSPEPTRWWHGVYTDHPGWSHLPGPTRTTTDVLNFPKRPCWHPGSPRITPDVPGQTRTTTDLHGSYTVHMPDHPGCDPCWSGTYMGLGLYTVSTRIAPDEAISPDQHGRLRMFWTFQNVRVGVPVPHGSPRTFPDKQGPPRTYTVATRFTRRIIPDVIRVDPAPIWDWGFIDLVTIFIYFSQISNIACVQYSLIAFYKKLIFQNNVWNDQTHLWLSRFNMHAWKEFLKYAIYIRNSDVHI